jgi:hypothetical protein
MLHSIILGLRVLQRANKQPVCLFVKLSSLVHRIRRWCRIATLSGQVKMPPYPLLTQLSRKANLSQEDLGGRTVALRSVTGLVLSSISLLLGACAIVDNFAPRIYSANVGSHFAANQEALLNIARASRYH